MRRGGVCLLPAQARLLALPCTCTAGTAEASPGVSALVAVTVLGKLSRPSAPRRWPSRGWRAAGVRVPGQTASGRKHPQHRAAAALCWAALVAAAGEA